MNAGDAPRDPRQRLGLAGEAAAERLLRRQGMTILARRYRCRHGEIDLVAVMGEQVVFVEVKTRRGRGCGLPAESVTPRKRRRMAYVALDFLVRRHLQNRPARFDVVEVYARSDATLELRHIPDAFRPSASDPGMGRL